MNQTSGLRVMPSVRASRIEPSGSTTTTYGRNGLFTDSRSTNVPRRISPRVTSDELRTFSAEGSVGTGVGGTVGVGVSVGVGVTVGTRVGIGVGVGTVRGWTAA